MCHYGVELGPLHGKVEVTARVSLLAKQLLESTCGCLLDHSGAAYPSIVYHFAYAPETRISSALHNLENAAREQ